MIRDISVNKGMIHFEFPAGVGVFQSHHHIETGRGAHPASYPMRTRGFIPRR